MDDDARKKNRYLHTSTFYVTLEAKQCISLLAEALERLMNNAYHMHLARRFQIWSQRSDWKSNFFDSFSHFPMADFAVDLKLPKT